MAPPPDTGMVACAPLPDRIAQLVIDCFEALPGRGKPTPSGRDWTVLAGVVAEEPAAEVGTASCLRTLCLATGTRCVGVASMVAAKGRAVHDCHAEVLCRRAFQRRLIGELARSRLSENKEAEDSKRRCILERCPASSSAAPRWRLRAGVRLHFYVSALPCGECALVPITSSNEGTLRRRPVSSADAARGGDGLDPVVEPLLDRNRTGAKPSLGMPEDPKAVGLGFHYGGILRYKSGRSDLRPGARSVSYSCSDKLCRWNHTGWQGALFSRLIEEPLTMATVVVGGSLFDARFVAEALFSRAERTGAASPEFMPTSVPFRLDREVLEVQGDPKTGVGVVVKTSTAGLCVVWSAPLADGPCPRSISKNVDGFYDVLVGHTGERHGVRQKPSGAGGAVRSGDIAAKASADGKMRVTAAARTLAKPAEPWVSPLSKVRMAEDLACALVVALGSENVALAWLLDGCRGKFVTSSISASPRKRHRVEEPQNGTAVAKASEEPAVVATYDWFKEAVTSAAYRCRREVFHATGPFVHWKRKRDLVFAAASSWDPAAAAAAAADSKRDGTATHMDDFVVGVPWLVAAVGGAAWREREATPMAT
mmetsp:Transcript_38454/g.105938  ORF Transcript_38454/g.105938 Transcript_38454/m.105938 type:complete len:595 (+) Transcript_38454:125-1909(+)